jgi:SanA protein
MIFVGFRTFDSVVRSQNVFGQSRVTIVSQQFHNERAVFIANAMGMQTVAYNAKDVRYLGGLITKVREKFARLLAVADMYLGTEPKFLGETIVIR